MWIQKFYATDTQIFRTDENTYEVRYEGKPLRIRWSGIEVEDFKNQIIKVANERVFIRLPLSEDDRYQFQILNDIAKALA